MLIMTRKPAAFAAAVMLALPTSGMLSAQELGPARSDSAITVYGSPPDDLSELAEGPTVEGFIAAQNGERIRVSNADGTSTVIRIADATDIRAKSGFLGLGRTPLTAQSLLNGLPVTVETVQWGDGLLASRVRLNNDDLETAAMIRSGTAQGFAEQTAATDALRSRVGDIDQYNIKGTTNVYFDTGKWALSADDKSGLCAAAAQAKAVDNALLLVVGYTDSVGSQEFNQQLSEKRAGRVVNYLQQECGWAPYRMLTPTGMAEADPLADNETEMGKAQNRRVAVNIMVSKAVDDM